MNKICFTCKSEKPVTDFYLNKQNKDGYQGICKICQKQNMKKYISYNEPDYSKEQICIKCNVLKSPYDFGKHRFHKNGLNNICKACVKKQGKDYNLLNKEKINEQQRIRAKKRYWEKRLKYLEENKKLIEVLKIERKEKAKAARKRAKTKYNKQNKEKINEEKRITRKKNIEELSDAYITEIIRNGSNIKYSEVKKYPELIETKRLEIKLNRIIDNYYFLNP